MKRYLALAVVPLLLATATTALAQNINELRRDLKDAISRGNVKDTETAVRGFVMNNTRQAAKALGQVLQRLERQTENEAIYWTLVKGMASFTNAESLEEVGEFIADNAKKEFGRDVMFMVQNNYSAACIYLCFKVLEKGTDEVKVMAIDHLGVLGNPEAVPKLISALEKEGKRNSEVKRRIIKALHAITGQDYGDSVSNWRGWWDKNKGQKWEGPKGLREGAGGQTTQLDEPRKNEIKRVKEIPPEKIVVIRGGPHDPGETKRNGGKELDHNFDHIEKTLTALGIPHIVITKEEFEKGFDLKDRLMVLINCTQWREHCVCEFCGAGKFQGFRLHRCVCSKKPEVHIPKEYKFSDAAVKRIKEFVDRGGYLFTEDWVLGEVLQRAWPELLKEGEYMQEDKFVGVLPAKGNTSHPYMRRVFGRFKKPMGSAGTGLAEDFDDIKHRWKIDKESPKISILDEKKVTVLMVSKDLGINNTVALTFKSGGRKENYIGTGKAADVTRYTGGRVLHVLSHFGKQQSRKDEYTLQNLLLNFFIECNNRYQLRNGRGNRRRK